MSKKVENRETKRTRKLRNFKKVKIRENNTLENRVIKKNTKIEKLKKLENRFTTRNLINDF